MSPLQLRASCFQVLHSATKNSVCRCFCAMAAGCLPSSNDSMRSYQVVVAATRDMGIGKDGKLPWTLPSDLRFFKELTSTTTSGPGKKNAVVMGRKTWESIPLNFRPLPGRLNVVLTRSRTFEGAYGENVVACGSIPMALKLLDQEPYLLSIENVFVIGGGQIFREALNASRCDAIHITEIETSFECDTFIPAVDFSQFRLWCSSLAIVENNVRFSFLTYVRVRNFGIGNLGARDERRFDGDSKSNEIEVEDFTFLPKMIFEKHDEFAYLRLVEEIISSRVKKDGTMRTGTLSKLGCQMNYNLRRSFPLLTTKQLSWQGMVEELLLFISSLTNEGQELDQLSDVIDKISNRPDDSHITLLVQNPSDKKLMALPPFLMFAQLQFQVANGELSCQMHQSLADMGLGVPLSIASYSLLTCIIAHVCGLVPGHLIYVIGDAYVYETDIGPLHKQIQKPPKPFPVLKINPQKKHIHSFLASDFELIGYNPQL